MCLTKKTGEKSKTALKNFMGPGGREKQIPSENRCRIVFADFFHF